MLGCPWYAVCNIFVPKNDCVLIAAVKRLKFSKYPPNRSVIPVAVFWAQGPPWTMIIDLTWSNYRLTFKIQIPHIWQLKTNEKIKNSVPDEDMDDEKF